MNVPVRIPMVNNEYGLMSFFREISNILDGVEY